MNIAYAIPLADTWGMHGDVGWGWMVGMMAFMIVFWGAIILGFVWLIRGGSDSRWGRQPDAPTNPSDHRETPIELLDRRFAEGTVSVEEYRARRRVLADGAEASSRSDEDALTGPYA